MKRTGDDTDERVSILEKAVANLADFMKKRDAERDEDLRDIMKEFKAMKMFLARAVPGFKKEILEIEGKMK
jgi:hypothetical protein